MKKLTVTKYRNFLREYDCVIIGKDGFIEAYLNFMKEHGVETPEPTEGQKKNALRYTDMQLVFNKFGELCEQLIERRESRKES